MTTHLFGIHWLLANVPVSITGFVLFVLCVGVLHIGRQVHEGLSYNISFASEIGDPAIIFAILVVPEILRRPEGVLEWMEKDSAFFMLPLIASIAFSAFYDLETRNPSRTVMDAFHNRIIAPVLFYLLITSVPVVWVHGSKVEMSIFFGLFFVWVVCMAYDYADGRLRQVKWMADHGIDLPLFRPQNEHRRSAYSHTDD